MLVLEELRDFRGRLAMTLQATGALADAEARFREALEIRESAMPAAEAQIAEARDALEACRRAFGRAG